jgi:hypothetical protein
MATLRRSANARLEARGAPLTPEGAARVAISGARPSVDEILSVWPADRRNRVVIWVKVGRAGNVVIGANLRERHVENTGHDLKHIRDDVPVVVEFHDRRTVVLPLRLLREPR